MMIANVRLLGLLWLFENVFPHTLRTLAGVDSAEIGGLVRDKGHPT